MLADNKDEKLGSVSALKHEIQHRGRIIWTNFINSHLETKQNQAELFSSMQNSKEICNFHLKLFSLYETSYCLNCLLIFDQKILQCKTISGSSMNVSLI